MGNWLDYYETAKKYAEKFKVPLEVVLAQADQESGFNPGAISPVGAVGIMQVMPDTAFEIARELGEKTAGSLSEPDVGLRYGIYYLSKMFRWFETPEKAIAAYNAGPGNVAYYGKVPPFAETQAYVKNVLAKAAKYKELIAAQAQKKPEKGEDYKVSPHFWRSEIECKCCHKVGTRDKNIKALLEMLEKLREKVDKAINLTCAYRCPAHNAEVGGATNSYHVQGMAADIWVKGLSVDALADAAETVGFGGVGRYYSQEFVHVDIGPVYRFTS